MKPLFAKIKYFFTRLYALKNKYVRTVRYRISSIDTEKQTVLLHIIHKNIFLKQTLRDIIHDPEIIDGLSCRQACWVGVYYGIARRRAMMNAYRNDDRKPPSNLPYLLRYKRGRYKVIRIHRDGTVGCVYVKTQRELTVLPVDIAQDDIFIQYFDANQACYIGMLAGMMLEKEKQASEKKHPSSYLRVVK